MFHWDLDFAAKKILHTAASEQMLHLRSFRKFGLRDPTLLSTLRSGSMKPLQHQLFSTTVTAGQPPTTS